MAKRDFVLIILESTEDSTQAYGVAPFPYDFGHEITVDEWIVEETRHKSIFRILIPKNIVVEQVAAGNDR